MLRSEVEFAAFLTYTPRGSTPEARRARNFVHDLKQDRARRTPPGPTSRFVARRLADLLPSLPFAEWLRPDVALIPVPKSALMQPDTLWVPERLVQEMVRVGLGREAPCRLERMQAVPKAALGTTAADRPSAEDHYRTLAVKPGIEVPAEIILVDDVVTAGATLLAAASRVIEAFPGSRVRAFAVVRTISNAAEFSGIVDPCVGMITLTRGGGTWRVP